MSSREVLHGLLSFQEELCALTLCNLKNVCHCDAHFCVLLFVSFPSLNRAQRPAVAASRNLTNALSNARRGDRSRGLTSARAPSSGFARRFDGTRRWSGLSPKAVSICAGTFGSSPTPETRLRTSLRQ